MQPFRSVYPRPPGPPRSSAGERRRPRRPRSSAGDQVDRHPRAAARRQQARRSARGERHCVRSIPSSAIATRPIDIPEQLLARTGLAGSRPAGRRDPGAPFTSKADGSLPVDFLGRGDLPESCAPIGARLVSWSTWAGRFLGGMLLRVLPTPAHKPPPRPISATDYTLSDVPRGGCCSPRARGEPDAMGGGVARGAPQDAITLARRQVGRLPTWSTPGQRLLRPPATRFASWSDRETALYTDKSSCQAAFTARRLLLLQHVVLAGGTTLYNKDRCKTLSLCLTTEGLPVALREKPKEPLLTSGPMYYHENTCSGTTTPR